jgi:prenyltransferase beta subunit
MMHKYERIASSLILAGLIILGMASAFDGLVSAQPEPRPAPEIAQAGSPVTPDHTEVVNKAMTYLKNVQAADGGFSGAFATIKVVLATAAAQYPMDYLTSISGTTALAYLETQAIPYTRNATGTLPSRLGLLATAAVAGETSPYTFGGVNLIHELTGTYHAATGAYSTTASAASALNQMWAVLGLAAAQEPVPMTATTYLIRLQDVASGGWDTSGWGPDVDSTAVALQALLASGHVTPTAATVEKALDYLRAQQQQGSWGYDDFVTGNYNVNPDSTAAAMQALAEVGYTPVTESWADGADPHTALVSCQQPDGSFVARDTVSDTFSSFWDATLGTANALPGLTETPLPIFGREQRARLALTWMQEQQAANGSWDSDVGATMDAVLAYAAAGFDPRTVMATGSLTSALDYLVANAAAYADQGAKQAGKLALVAELGGGDANHFGSVNLVDLLTNTYYSPTLQAFGVSTDTYQQAFPILGLAAAEAPLPAGVTATLAGLQQSDGGWKIDLGSSPYNLTGPDHTGVAMQALLAGGMEVSDTVIVSATQYLANQQIEGGWGSWGTVNANSTAYAMQGLLAAEEDLHGAKSTWRQAGRGPFDALASFQKSDGPFVWAWAAPPFGYSDNGLATWQAVPALLGAFYPFTPGTLTPFSPVERGPDPDRIVTMAPRISLDHGADLVMPFGSDLDQDVTLTVTWRMGERGWQTATVHRANGFFTATLNQGTPGLYEVSALFEDPDGIQGSANVGIYHTWMPLLLRSVTR